MNKYAKYASWLAKAIIAVAAVANFVMYFKTLENVYSAMFGSSVALLLALDAMDELLKLKKRIEVIESKQSGFVSFMKVAYDEQLDCKERVDNLTKTLNGDE